MWKYVDLDDVRRRQDAGESLRQIGADLGLSASALSRRLRGLTRQAPTPTTVTRDTLTAILGHPDARTTTDVAKLAGCSTGAVIYGALRAGLYADLTTGDIYRRHVMTVDEARWWRREYETTTQAELARQTGLSEATVRNRLMQAGVKEFRPAPGRRPHQNCRSSSLRSEHRAEGDDRNAPNVHCNLHEGECPWAHADRRARGLHPGRRG